VQKECRSQDVVRRMSCLAGAVFGSGRSRFGLVVLKCDLFRLIVIALIRMQERVAQRGCWVSRDAENCAGIPLFWHWKSARIWPPANQESDGLRVLSEKHSRGNPGGDGPKRHRLPSSRSCESFDLGRGGSNKRAGTVPLRVSGVG